MAKERAARLPTLMVLTHINFNKGLLMENKLLVNAATLNAMVSAMGALAMAVARQMTPEQREGMGLDLASIAKHAESSGDTVLETLLIDMHRAIR